MKVISVIDNEQVIEKILKHLGLWEVKARPPPKTNPSPKGVHIDYSARPGATRLPIAAQTMHCSKCNFLRISPDDRSGPGILKFQVQMIIFTPIRITRLRLMTGLKPYGFFKTALGISGSGVSGLGQNNVNFQ